jgi:hypothetical protein
MLGDRTISLCEVLQHRRDNEFVVDARLGCTTKVVKDIMTDESISVFLSFIFQVLSSFHRCMLIYD